MDFPQFQISLWMFLVIIFSVSTGDCRSSPKYVVASSKKNNQVNDNCFCFKYSGDYQKVPEILSNIKGNPERIVVFLYKDNSTEHIKMYIPNQEKQALIPDLAFEVGDKLNTIEPDQKIMDIYNINSRTIDNTPIPIDHEHPQVDGNNDAIYIDDGNYDEQHEKPDTYSHEEPLSEVNIPPVVPNDDDHHGPYDNADVDSHEIPSKEIIETPTVNVDDDTYHVQSDERKVDSSEVPSKVISVPPVTINTVDTIDQDDEQHDKSNIDYEIPSKEVNVPPIDINGDDDDHPEHNHNPDYYEIPSKEVNVPPIDINADEADIDSNGAPSTEVKVPLIDDTDYNVKPNIDSHELPPMNINGDADNYDWQQYNKDVDAEKVSSNELNESHITIDYSDEDQYEQYDKLNIDSYEIESEKIPPANANVDDGDYYEQHDQPDLDPNNVPPKVIYVDKDDHDKYSPIEINIESSDETSEESISNEYEMSLESRSSEEIGYSYETDVNGEKTHSNRNKTKPINDKHNNNYETFDRWFIHQMQRFKTYTKHDRAVSLLTIERYILKILHNNHMHVTAEGVLTDSYGTALDVRNLHLRPILIGNTMAFKSILKDVRDLVIPENMAYLQAILVTNSHPSMILGIIPIGKTIIPPSTANDFSVLNPNPYSSWLHQERQRNIHKPISKGSSSKNNIIGNTRYFISKKKPILVHLSRKTHKPVNLGRNIGRTIITVVEKKPVTVQSIHQKPITNIKVYGDNVLNGVNEFNMTDSSVEVFNKLLISLRNGEDPIRSAEATNKLLAALQNGGSTLTSPVEIDDKNDAGEEDITDRIVGGKAATSSGTPLSMKGRMKDI